MHYGYFSMSRGKWQVVLPFYNHRRIPEAQRVSSIISENVYTAVPKITKWIKDLNVRPETIIHLEESRGITLFNISLSNVFLDRNPQKR